jgi:hypothetical protein
MKSSNSKASLSTPCTTSYTSGCGDFRRGFPSIDVKELHMRLRVLLPEQFEPQRYQQWPYREYTLKFPMPNGGNMQLWFRGEHLRVTLSPAANELEVANDAD